MARTIAIWVFGLLASAIIGGLVGSRLATSYGSDEGFWGVLAAMFAFACIRLWLGGSSWPEDAKNAPSPKQHGSERAEQEFKDHTTLLSG
jgi:uncharacterized membrane protein YfcA